MHEVGGRTDFGKCSKSDSGPRRLAFSGCDLHQAERRDLNRSLIDGARLGLVRSRSQCHMTVEQRRLSGAGGPWILDSIRSDSGRLVCRVMCRPPRTPNH